MTIEVKMNAATYPPGTVSGLVRDKIPSQNPNDEVTSKVNLEEPNKSAKSEDDKANSGTSVSGSEIDEAVTELNSSIQTIQRNLQFSVDKDLDKIVINVTDKQTEEIIRQIPSEDFLELARNLQDMMENRENNSKNSGDSFLFSSSA
ncbi:MAG: flagellar protein FlaG [Pseudomonadota bacterium]